MDKAATTYQQLQDNVKLAMKSGLKHEVDVLRMVIAAIKNRAIEEHTKDELPEALVIDVIQKEAKKRRESIEMFKTGGREDLAKNEALELEIIEAYLPAQLSREEVVAEIEKLIAGGLNTFPALMKEASQRFKGRADGKMVAEVAKEKLG